MDCLNITIFYVLFTCWLWLTKATCPQMCSCTFDNLGRASVGCFSGGMTGSIPVVDIKADTELINITPPENNMNDIQLGPVFDKFTNLKELYIRKSNIPELGIRFFYFLRNLTVLDLSQNNITQPLKDSFSGLNNLKSLILDDNRIESLVSETFKCLEQLTLLSIRRNKVLKLPPRVFLHLRRLKILNLSGNHLQTLPQDIFEDIRQLKEFECRGCALDSMNSKVFKYLQKLETLDFGNNEISEITAEDFKHLTNLKTLRLDFNQITKIINSDFSYMISLENLNLARNGISKIDACGFKNLKLKSLDISYNKLEKLEDEVLNILSKNLEKLWLSGNYIPISTLEAVNNVHFLWELYMRNMGITEIPPRTLPCNLKVLDLSKNNLFNFDPDVVPSNLQELDISYNKFRGLNEKVLSRINNIPTLHLKGNPWLCDECHMGPGLIWANASESLRNVECSGPVSLRGRKLGSISSEEIEWCTIYENNDLDASGYFFQDTRLGIIAATAFALIFILAISAIILGLCYWKRHSAKYYTHEEKRAPETESIFENQTSFLGDDKEISFKFPMDYGEKKVSIATIDDEIRKDKTIVNGF